MALWRSSAALGILFSPTDVTNAFDNEISGTARNPNSVSMLGIMFSEPPTQSELQGVVDKVNELIGSLIR